MSANDIKEYITLKGGLSESDSVLVLLELVKKESRLIVLPAPKLFEGNRRAVDRNVDILLIDSINKQTHGIQVKTDTVEGMGSKHAYDKNYVTVIDSAYELGNTAYMSSSVNHRASLPGQIAMSLLSERPLKDIPVAVHPSEFMRTRQIAKELSRGKRSFLDQATRHLADCVIPRLEKDPITEVSVFDATVVDTQAESDKIA